MKDELSGEVAVTLYNIPSEELNLIPPLVVPPPDMISKVITLDAADPVLDLTYSLITKLVASEPSAYVVPGNSFNLRGPTPV